MKRGYVWVPIITILFLCASLGAVLGAPAAQEAPAAQAQSQSSESGQAILDFLDNTASRGGFEASSGLSSEDRILKIIGNIINVVLGLVGIIFFILIMWAGVRWMMSAGNEEVVQEAKKTIKTSVIGISVIFLSFLFTNFVLNQIKDITSSTEPPAATVAPEGSETGTEPAPTQEETGAPADDEPDAYAPPAEDEPPAV